MEYNLYQKFDLNQHNIKYINYCEVIITKMGEIMYATPSHQTFMLAMYGVKLGIFDKDILQPANTTERLLQTSLVWEHIPTDADVREFLTNELECICVYTDLYLGPKPNRRQSYQLKRLQASGACKFRT